MAPGYQPVVIAVRKDEIKNGVADLGDLSLKQIVAKAGILKKNIKELPTGFNAPPLTDYGSFGGVR